jgi:four helix bundle protein
VAKLGHVVEEADESRYWLEMIKGADIVRSDELDGLLREAGELCAIFNKSQLTARDNQRRRRAADSTS